MLPLSGVEALLGRCVDASTRTLRHADTPKAGNSLKTCTVGSPVPANTTIASSSQDPFVNPLKTPGIGRAELQAKNMPAGGFPGQNILLYSDFILNRFCVLLQWIYRHV